MRVCNCFKSMPGHDQWPQIASEVLNSHGRCGWTCLNEFHERIVESDFIEALLEISLEKKFIKNWWKRHQIKEKNALFPMHLFPAFPDHPLARKTVREPKKKNGEKGKKKPGDAESPIFQLLPMLPNSNHFFVKLTNFIPPSKLRIGSFKKSDQSFYHSMDEWWHGISSQHVTWHVKTDRWHFYHPSTCFFIFKADQT